MSTYFKNQPTPDTINQKIQCYSSWLEIDLDNLTHNLTEIKKHVEVPIMAVVKNNAYGHGLIPVTAHLETLGVKWCMVAKLYEAVKIREAGLKLGILNMDVLYSDEQYSKVVEEEIAQCIYTREDADKLNSAASKLGKHAKVFIKVDTGLNRIGVRYSEAAELIQYIHNLEFIDVQGIFSTFQQNQEDPKMLAKLLLVDQQLKEKGIRIGIDDFGTGYSSLSYLKVLPVDKLKIDRSFIKDVSSDNDRDPIIVAIVAVAQSLGLKVVAEGIETRAQTKLLESLGCDQIQGFYFGRPVSGEDYAAFLQEPSPFRSL